MRPMMTGPSSVAPELTSIATTATASAAAARRTISGAKRLSADAQRALRTELPGRFSSLYFVVAGASLRVIDLDVFGRRLHAAAACVPVASTSPSISSTIWS